MCTSVVLQMMFDHQVHVGGADSCPKGLLALRPAGGGSGHLGPLIPGLSEDGALNNNQSL